MVQFLCIAADTHGSFLVVRSYRGGKISLNVYYYIYMSLVAARRGGSKGVGRLVADRGERCSSSWPILVLVIHRARAQLFLQWGVVHFPLAHAPPLYL